MQDSLQHKIKARVLAISAKKRYPVVMLAIAICIAVLLLSFRPHLEPQGVERSLIAVRTLTVDPQAEILTIHSQGTVKPRVEGQLTPEVSGRVVWLSPALVTGGSFNKGDLLFRIDDSDYRNSHDRSKASVSRAEVEYELAESDNTRQQQLFSKKLSSQSQVDQALRAYRVAEANLIEARISLEQSRLNLKRVRISAPYTGRVLNESVDVGEYVSSSKSVASIYATDTFEIRLPVANSQFAYLNLSSTESGMIDEMHAPKVTIYGEYGGAKFEWLGEMVRTEAVIDAQSRMLYGVARVKTEYSKGRPPLVVGLFVKADIEGRAVENVIRLPRSAMRDDNQLLVVDEEDRLRFRKVKILRVEYDDVLVSGGLVAGERVCVSPLQVVVDGMQVKPIDVTPAKAEPEVVESIEATTAGGEPEAVDNLDSGIEKSVESESLEEAKEYAVEKASS
ncbi:MAG: RND family efflux transporter MFP subunit [Pseudomonadales bacterium]|jgi:RND family efflux transporter MFP subunit